MVRTLVGTLNLSAGGRDFQSGPPRIGTAMLNTITAVLTAAAIAALITLLSAPGNSLDAGPLPKTAETALMACTQQPWPYFNCVGSPLGNPRIRLVTTDRLG
jgi:hypothetical protein